MKIAVYAIAKNEAKHVEQFMAGVRDADLVFVADTGSTDGTVELLRAAGATVAEIKVEPWRFDVARNMALDLLPDDIDVCFSLDLDEVPQPGWRRAIEEAWTPDTKRLRYLYNSSHRADGTPDRTYYYEKLHARRGSRWFYPCHETLLPLSPPGQPYKACAVVVDHYPDKAKPRTDYLALLQISVRENPEDFSSSFYLGREYMFHKMWQECIAELQRCLPLLPGAWSLTRCAALRYIARSQRMLGRPGEAFRWLFMACAEGIDQREPWVDLAQLYDDFGGVTGTYFAATTALAITERSKHFSTEGYAWDKGVEELASRSQKRLSKALRKNVRATLQFSGG